MKSYAAVAAVCARFFGLLMIAASLPVLGQGAARIWKHAILERSFDFISPFIDYGSSEDIYSSLGWLLLFLLGLYLLLGGRLITRLLIRPLLANCQSCGYPLTSIKATRCPECGHDNPKRE